MRAGDRLSLVPACIGFSVRQAALRIDFLLALIGVCSRSFADKQSSDLAFTLRQVEG
jgi:hypothetical protein